MTDARLKKAGRSAHAAAHTQPVSGSDCTTAPGLELFRGYDAERGVFVQHPHKSPLELLDRFRSESTRDTEVDPEEIAAIEAAARSFLTAPVGAGLDGEGTDDVGGE